MKFQPRAPNSSAQPAKMGWGAEMVAAAKSRGHGVHVVYNYRLGTTVHTFDQTALVNDDVSKIYLFLLRCTAACFTDRRDEIATVVRSFTVRPTR